MRISAAATKLIGAQPEKVYAILASPEHHKRILPEDFSKFEVEADGTWKVQVKAAFLERSMQILPEAVEANRHFRETDLTRNSVTNFRLEPHPDGTLVTISSIYERNGLIGFVESLIAPAYLRNLYEEELTKLCRYALVADL